MEKTIQELLTVHPGEYLRDELEARNLSQSRLAMEIRVPPARISDIVNGRRGITADTACRLARYFGTSAELWLHLQSAYDKRMATRKLEETGELEKIRPQPILA